jgi:hypothetical protein
MITLRDLPAERRLACVWQLSQLLAKSVAFRDRAKWPLAVVVLRDPGESYVTSRVDFAAYLRANDLHGVARECVKRRARPGHVLIWLEVDEQSVAASGFEEIDLAAEARSLRTMQLDYLSPGENP